MERKTKWLEPSLLWPAALVATLLPLLAAVPPVLRYDHLAAPGKAWSSWPLTPALSLATLLVPGVYGAGECRRTTPAAQRHASAHLAFFGGVAAVFLALQSPLETLSDHLFIAHQLEHMLLRTVGPMLLMLSSPEGRCSGASRRQSGAGSLRRF